MMGSIMGPLGPSAQRLAVLHCLRASASANLSECWGRGMATSADNSNVLLPGALHPLAPAFQENKVAMDGLVARLRQLIATAVRGGGDKAIKRHRERGKLLPRERIDALLDPGSPFLELSQLAGHNMYGALPLQALAGCPTPSVLLPPQVVRQTRRHTTLLQVHAEHRSCAHKPHR